MTRPVPAARNTCFMPTGVAGAVFVSVLALGVASGRDDPRPVADAPAGVESPPGRRTSRRAYRRSHRRRTPDVAPPVEATPQFGVLGAVQAVEVPRPPAPRPAGNSDGVLLHRDQPYGGTESRHPRQRFDLHLPEGCGGGLPLVVWIHGDSWRDGSKADCPVTWLVGQGYAVASVGYRLTDTAVFPAQFDDCRAAIATIVRDADLWGIDPGRIAVVGSGGGGHLAALVGLAGQPPTAGGADSKQPAEDPVFRVACVCALSAPTSLTTLGPEQDRPASPASRLVGGPLTEFREAARRASPVTHVSADDPPVLLVHGSRDAMVPVCQAVEFDKALTAAGVDCTLVTLEDYGHGLVLGPGTPAGQALCLFLERVLEPEARPAHDREP